jgi:DNA-binding MarR family transcriptional regulator
VQEDTRADRTPAPSASVDRLEEQKRQSECSAHAGCSVANDESAVSKKVPRIHLDLDPTDAAALVRILASISDQKVGPRTVDDASTEVHIARMMFEGRNARARLFPRSMFNEPAWDMLLALYLAKEAPAATDLAKWTNTPLTTATRWIVYLEVHRLISRGPCAADRRVQRIRLTDQARTKIKTLLSELAGLLP